MIWQLDGLVNDDHISALLPGSYKGKLTSLKSIQLQKMPFLRSNPVQRILVENFWLPRYARRQRVDLFHGPAAALPMFSPAGKTVLTVHDLLAFGKPALCQRRTAWYHQSFMERFIRKADRIIAVSETVKADIINRFHVLPGRIDVIYNGVDPDLKKITDKERLDHVRNKYQLPARYILYLGNIERKKNLCGLLKAYSLVSKELPEYKLVLAGRLLWGSEEVLREIKKLALSTDVILPGFIEPSDLAEVYSMADVFVFFSHYEGFGIPPLEAMACDTPVIISDQGALPEISGNAAMQVPVSDTGLLGNAIRFLISDRSTRQEQIRLGRIQVNKFNWKETAKKTLDVYKSLL